MRGRAGTKERRADKCHVIRDTFFEAYGEEVREEGEEYYKAGGVREDGKVARGRRGDARVSVT